VKQRTRKFIGVWLMIALVIIYPMLVAIFLSNLLALMPTWLSLIFFLIIGLFWAVPAGVLIKWMTKPDSE